MPLQSKPAWPGTLHTVCPGKIRHSKASLLFQDSCLSSVHTRSWEPSTTASLLHFFWEKALLGTTECHSSAVQLISSGNGSAWEACRCLLPTFLLLAPLPPISTGNISRNILRCCTGSQSWAPAPGTPKPINEPLQTQLADTGEKELS